MDFVWEVAQWIGKGGADFKIHRRSLASVVTTFGLVITVVVVILSVCMHT